MAVVECDRARLKDGREVTITEATSGANGYYCLGCGYELVARKGLVNEPHFAHLAAGPDAGHPCQYSSETYRHELAKQLLHQLKKVRVPAVYAARPLGYRGRLPLLAEARDVAATSVQAECNVYVDEHGEVCFDPRHHDEPFDDHQGQRVLLARPDVVFFDDQGQHLLLIEIYATHKVSEEKLARLRLLAIDAIEIEIPRHLNPAAIQELFSVTTNTHWLYNAQQANAQPLAPDSHLLAGGSAAAAGLEDRLSGRAETLKCRRSRVGHALRAIRNCLGRADIQAVHREIALAQATGETFTAGLEADRDERDERLGAAERERVSQYRTALANQERHLAEEEAALSRAERELAGRIRADEERLGRVVADLTQRINRAESAADDEFGSGMARLRDERWRVRAELTRLDHQAAAAAEAG